MKSIVTVLFCWSYTSILIEPSDDLVHVDTISRDDKACKSWPKLSKLPIECCSVPELFKTDIKDKCISNCSHPNDQTFNTWCCSSLCILEESDIVIDGKFDVENAKRFLSKAFEKNEKMTKVLDDAVDKCNTEAADTDFKQDNGKVECSTPQYGFLISCIHQELFKACPETKADADCKEVKEFMEKCPKQQPPLKQAKLRSTRMNKDNLGDAMKDTIKDDGGQTE